MLSDGGSQMRWFHIFLAIGAIMLVLSGCSGSDGPVTPSAYHPGLSPDVHQATGTSRVLWGYWQITIDTATLQASIIPARSGSLHVNTLIFLEPPSGSTLGISGITIDGSVIECDITLVHPFPGLNQYAGFDVRGILIADASISGFNDPGVVLSGPDETRLLNADGLTRWWNPVEFPNNGTMFSYRDGKLGNSDSAENYGATLNGYRAFADCLDASDPPSRLVDPSLPGFETRALFAPGHANTRHYIIDFSENGLGDPDIVFNYAVDASWEAVQPPPTVLPDDFPLIANCPEAFLIEIDETLNTLYNVPGIGSGGTLGLDIHVHDWQGALDGTPDVPGEVSEVTIESPGLFTGPATASVVPSSGSGLTFSTWHVEIDGQPSTNDDYMVLVSVVSSNGDWQPGFTGWDGSAPLTAYQTTRASVGTEPPYNASLHLITPDGGETWQQGCPYTIEWESDGDPIDSVDLEYSTDGFSTDINEIVPGTPNDGEYEWEIPDITSDTVRVRVSDSAHPGVNDISDGDFSINAPGPAYWQTQKYDYQRSGVSPYEGPTTNNLLWETSVSAEMTPGPTIGDDGTIYTGTNDGRFIALDTSGDILWELNLGSYVLGSGSITEDGRIYVGSWNGTTGYLYAIECEGDIVWQFDCLGNINHATPVIGADGTVYIGNNNGRFWAVNPDGTEKWNFVMGGGFTPSPSLGSDGSIYVTSVNSHAYGLTDNGQGDYTIFWDHEFPGEHIGCPPAVDTDNPFVDNDVVYVSGLYDDILYACDPFTDTILWTGAMGQGTSESSATIGPDHTVYIGCNDGKLYAFNQGGTVAWTFQTGQQITAAPIIDPDGRLYVPSRDFFIYCLDTTDNGTELWSYETGDIIRTEIAIAPDGTLYCGGHDGYLRAFKDE